MTVDPPAAEDKKAVKSPPAPKKEKVDPAIAKFDAAVKEIPDDNKPDGKIMRKLEGIEVESGDPDKLHLAYIAKAKAEIAVIDRKMGFVTNALRVRRRKRNS